MTRRPDIAPPTRDEERLARWVRWLDTAGCRLVDREGRPLDGPGLARAYAATVAAMDDAGDEPAGG